jgi:hypothetical protein
VQPPSARTAAVTVPRTTLRDRTEATVTAGAVRPGE